MTEEHSDFGGLLVLHFATRLLGEKSGKKKNEPQKRGRSKPDRKREKVKTDPRERKVNESLKKNSSPLRRARGDSGN